MNGEELVRFARARLKEELGGEKAERPSGSWTEEPGATFVTLRWSDDGRLQGCIGKLEPHGAILDDVEHNSIAAAMRDPRAEPVSLADVDALDVELSILSPLERVKAADEAEALRAIVAGEHGVVLAHGGRRATFLPSMWSQLPDKRKFFSALKQKAGFHPDFWAPDLQVFRYTVDKHVDAGRRSS